MTRVVLCMTPEERRLWDEVNGVAGDKRAPSPCFDCLAPFAREMRAVSLCNGTPGRSPAGRPRLPSTGGATERQRAHWRAASARHRANRRVDGPVA